MTYVYLVIGNFSLSVNIHVYAAGKMGDLQAAEQCRALHQVLRVNI